MRIRATCTNCGRDFYFFQLYRADPVQNDRCPHCSTHLGIPGVRHLAQEAEQAAAILVGTLQRIAVRNPRFTVHADTVLPAVSDALDALDTLAAGDDRAAQPHVPRGLATCG
jgi:hypothetical protein